MLDQDFAKAVEQFRVAQKEAAKYQGLSLEDQLASVNELRYVGHHILRAAGNRLDAESCSDDLRSARKHGQRAVNDIRDGALLVNLTTIRTFLNKQYTSQEMLAAPEIDDRLLQEVVRLRNRFENAGMPSSFGADGGIENDLKRMCDIRSILDGAIARLDCVRERMRRREAYRWSHHRWSILRESKRRALAAGRRRIAMMAISFLLSVFSLVTLMG